MWPHLVTSRKLNTDASIDLLFSTLDIVLPCITDNERKLPPTVCNDLNFEKMKSAIKELFFSSKNTKVNQQQIRLEELYYTRKLKDFK